MVITKKKVISFYVLKCWFSKKIYLFIYFWLCWFFAVVCRLLIAVASPVAGHGF